MGTTSHYWDAPVRPRLHVLHVSMPTTAGTAVVARQYVREQVDRGWNVTVACPSQGWLGYSARDLGARVRWWSASREVGASVLGEMATLRRIVRETRPDVVHLHSAKAGLVGRLVLRGSIPTVFQPHGWSFLASGGRTGAGALRWERLATRWTDELVCVSADELELGENYGVRAASSSVLPNGVDLDAWPRQGRAGREEARAELGLSGAPIAVCVGRLAEQKGQHDLLDAWPAVRREVEDAELVLVGDGPDAEALAARAADLDGVSLVGDRTDTATWLAAANVVAVPSRWEGMALVPLEAMATGRSVVATRVTGIAESVPEGAGAVVTPGAQDELAEALVQRLRYRGEADDEGEVGRDHVTTHHDAASSAHELAQVYLRLLAERRRSPR